MQVICISVGLVLIYNDLFMVLCDMVSIQIGD